MVRDGDDEWADAVNWAVIATMQAEEFGITQDNVEDQKSSENPDILRFLGEPIPNEEDPEAEPEPFDPGLGLDADFAANVDRPPSATTARSTTARSAQTRRWRSNAASTPSGRTAASSMPRRTARARPRPEHRT